jgi:hypothetical protein
MYTVVDMDGVGRKVKLWEWVMEHRNVFRENVSVKLGDVILCFTTMDGSKVKGSMDACIGVSKVQPTIDGHKYTCLGMGLGGIGWPNKVPGCCGSWGGNVAKGMIL